MTVVVRNRIGADQRDASDGASFERANPARSDEVVSVAPESTMADVADAVDAASAAAPGWARRGPSERAALLEAAADALTATSLDLARELVREEGKPLGDASNEARRTPQNLRLYAGEALRLTGTTFPSDDPSSLVTMSPGPVGVVGVITPWNFPLNLASRKIGPALAAGNTVVFKPSPFTPLMGERLAASFESAGFPPGVVNVVHGFAAGAHLVADERVGAVTFTGSTATGAKIRQAVGLGRRVQLELGGKNPIVVLDDADLDRAATVVFRSSFSLSGQACTGAGRVLTTPAVHDELLERVVALAGNVTMGDGLDDGVTMGPLVDRTARDAIVAAVDRAREQGARLVVGGEIPTSHRHDRGWFYPPTIFADVTPDMELAREEVFGPVIGFERVADLDEALQRVNSLDYGLTAAICTADLAQAQRFWAEAEAGMVKVNRPTVGAALNQPFGGIKHSGTETHKEQLGPTVMDFYTRNRTLVIGA